jgi:predicted nucleotidyltransferase
MPAGALPRYPWVQAAYLHGSAAATERPARDIDIALVCAEPPAWDVEGAIASDLHEAFPLPPIHYDVRCVLGASPIFLHRVLVAGKLVYESDRSARVWFEAKAISRWLDYQPCWERVRREVLRKWSGG